MKKIDTESCGSLFELFKDLLSSALNYIILFPGASLQPTMPASAVPLERVPLGVANPYAVTK